jgi:hypothetical protein
MNYIRSREDREGDLVGGSEFVDPATWALGWIGPRGLGNGHLTGADGLVAIAIGLMPSTLMC